MVDVAKISPRNSAIFDMTGFNVHNGGEYLLRAPKAAVCSRSGAAHPQPDRKFVDRAQHAQQCLTKLTNYLSRDVQLGSFF